MRQNLREVRAVPLKRQPTRSCSELSTKTKVIRQNQALDTDLFRIKKVIQRNIRNTKHWSKRIRANELQAMEGAIANRKRERKAEGLSDPARKDRFLAASKQEQKKGMTENKVGIEAS